MMRTVLFVSHNLQAVTSLCQTGIVMQRGKNAHTPQVASILGLRGAPIEKPILIDTSNPNYEITGSVSADDVRLRMSWAELLEKFKQAPST